MASIIWIFFKQILKNFKLNFISDKLDIILYLALKKKKNTDFEFKVLKRNLFYISIHAYIPDTVEKITKSNAERNNNQSLSSRLRFSRNRSGRKWREVIFIQLEDCSLKLSRTGIAKIRRVKIFSRRDLSQPGTDNYTCTIISWAFCGIL